jgi:hypothetical protein
LITIQLNAQFHLGAFLGGANYLGELNSEVYKRTKPAVGLSLNYEVSDRVMLRSQFSIAKVEGADKYNNSEYEKLNRNLSFQSNIAEFSLIGELTAFNLYSIRWSPYAFGGLAIFHFNPYTSDSANNKVYLRPLSTEGEGLSNYPNRRPYSLTQFAIPFGGGIKYVVNENIRIGLEIGLRKLFTDYLDDVSSNYVDPQDLLAAHGSTAVAISYRGDEVPGGDQASYPDNGYPAKGALRGNPKKLDWYYFSGIHVTFRLGNGYGKTAAHRYNKGLDCPKRM